MPKISVITATRGRPAQLASCLKQFRAQSLGDLTCEIIVVADGPDPAARAVADRFGVDFHELPESLGCAGAAAKDFGVTQAKGDWVCFWDDDNWYEPHALATIFATVAGFHSGANFDAEGNADMGVVRASYRCRKRSGFVSIPRRWTGTFVFGDIDTMCVIVRRSLAVQELWYHADSSCGTDYRWFKKLEAHQPVIRYVPLEIGIHL